MEKGATSRIDVVPLERIRRVQFFWGLLGRRESTLSPDGLLALYEGSANFGGTSLEDLLSKEEREIAEISRTARDSIRPVAWSEEHGTGHAGVRMGRRGPAHWIGSESDTDP